MKRIPLSGKHGKGKFALVDDEDYDYLSQFSWFVNKNGYVVRTVNYNRDDGTRTMHSIRMHREVMGVTDPSIHVDHKFGNKLDNRKGKLRACSCQQNNMNRKSVKNSSSKYKGVMLYKITGKWKASIKYNGINYHLGYFDSEDEAALAYNNKAKEFFGKYAMLNVVKG